MVEQFNITLLHFSKIQKMHLVVSSVGRYKDTKRIGYTSQCDKLQSQNPNVMSSLLRPCKVAILASSPTAVIKRLEKSNSRDKGPIPAYSSKAEKSRQQELQNAGCWPSCIIVSRAHD